MKGFLAAAEDLKLKGIFSIDDSEEKVFFPNYIKSAETQYDRNFENEDLKVLSKKTDGHKGPQRSSDLG